MVYQPDPEILDKYADVFVRFALNGGRGIKTADVVQLIVPDTAKPLLLALDASVLKAGGNPYLRYYPTGVDRPFFDLASDAQLDYFNASYMRARVDMLAHTVSIIAEHDMHELEGVPAEKIMRRGRAIQPLRQWFNEKERQKLYSWTLGLYGTPAMALEAKMTLEEYWQQIILACYLDEADPIAQWQKTYAEIERVRFALNALPIDQIHVESANGTDLWLKLGDHRQWVGGSGRNIPSYEIFTSPHRDGTRGAIVFDQPLYRYGVMVTGIKLVFENGAVVHQEAEQGLDVLTEMLNQPNAGYVGEFSMTDRRLSRISRFMAETLYDENVGGPFGNSHIAVGMSYTDAFDGDASQVTPESFEALGFNDISCSVHTDMITTADRTVTVVFNGGGTRVIYRNGQFTV